MRKHDVRKWLHAVLDLLPVILIPVFMIYSHRHDVTQDFEVVEQQPIYYETNEVTQVADILVGRIYLWTDNYLQTTFTSYTRLMQLKVVDIYPFSVNDVVRIEMYCSSNYIGLAIVHDDNTNTYFNISDTNINFIPDSVNSSNVSQLPGIFDSITESDLLVVKEYQDVITTIPKDVMTSFMDRFNNTIDNYFNMGNVFNLNGVYEWFNTNIFSGNAPTVIYSIWNIALYELVMDLLFLLYGLFMWFIDMVEHLMEKPFKSIK